MNQRVTDYIASIYDKKIHVLGVSGVEGAEIALFLSKWGCPNLVLHDQVSRDNFFGNFAEAHFALPSDVRESRFSQLSHLPVEFRFADAYATGIADADIIFVPQSWYLYEVNDALRDEHVRKKLHTITQLYFALLPCKIIGVTGSNGKTTTSALINAMLSASPDHTVHYAGNDRRNGQLLGIIDTIAPDDWALLEISNRQLLFDLGRSPVIAVYTNITPNHLTEHAGFEDYVAVKKSLVHYQTAEQWRVINIDDPVSVHALNDINIPVCTYSTHKRCSPGCYREGDILYFENENREEICRIADIALRGAHNISNVLAAVATATLAGVKQEVIRGVIATFEHVPQRLELIATVHGVRYYNDTASTTPESTIAALESFNEQTILIAGGKNKGLDLCDLARIIVAREVRLVLLQSPLSDELLPLLTEAKMPRENIYIVNTLKHAVEKASQLATLNTCVVFSPAGEYFWYFKDGQMPGYKNYRKFVEKLV